MNYEQLSQYTETLIFYILIIDIYDFLLIPRIDSMYKHLIVINIQSFFYYSKSLIDQNVGILVEDLLYLGYFRVIEDIIPTFTQNYRPVMAALHTTLVNHSSNQPIISSIETLYLTVQYGVSVLQLLAIYRLESIQVYDKRVGICFNVQLFEGQSHRVTVRAVPCVFLVQLFRLAEQLYAIVNSGISDDQEIILLVFNLNDFAQKHLESHLKVFTFKKVFKSYIELFWKKTSVALFLAEFANISTLF